MSGHQEWLELAAAHVLDALDPDDRARFEAHLATCERCRAELESLRAASVAIAHAAEPVEPPEGMRQRLLARALRGSEDAAAAPLPSPARSGWRNLAVAAGIAAIVALGAYRNARIESARLRADLDAALESLGATRAEVARQGELLAALAAPDVVTATLAGTGAPPSARLFWNRDRGVAVLTAFNLPAPTAGRTYQLWGIDTAAGSAPVSLGTFESDGASVIVSVTMPAGTFDVAAVTDEPTGGSPQPTTTPFLVGTFSTP